MEKSGSETLNKLLTHTAPITIRVTLFFYSVNRHCMKEFLSIENLPLHQSYIVQINEAEANYLDDTNLPKFISSFKECVLQVQTPAERVPVAGLGFLRVPGCVAGTRP